MRTPEQALRDMISEQISKIAHLTSENEKLMEENRRQTEQIREISVNYQKLLREPREREKIYDK